MKHVAVVAETLLGSYAILWLGELVWNLLFRAPKAIYAGCITELVEYRKSAQKELESLRNDATERIRSQQLATEGGAQRIAAFEVAIARKHPHDEHKEVQVAKALAELNEAQRRTFVWLLDAGEATRGKLQGMGLDAEYFSHREGFPPLLTQRSLFSGNGAVELERFYSINPTMVESLRNVVYPPPRPATPLQV
jgi:hypothetical protein